ncbi:MAG TPA: hypothetical protein VHB21_12785 [Minicystis sp.]|nr:hypothetical protein [Minicystis sp.]
MESARDANGRAPRREELRRAAVAYVVLVAASVAFRLPSLVDAAATNSDAAVPALQAMHALRGELSPFLWGSGYQTSADAIVAAAWFAVFGPTPLALMLSTLAGHVALTLFAFATLRRHLGTHAAALLVLLLVFTGGPVHTYVLYPPRQASLTLAFAALYLLDRGARGARPAAWIAAGAAVAGLAVGADPYALLFWPGLVAFALSLGHRRAAVAGAALGALPYLVLRALPGATHGQTSLSLAVVAHNAALLVDSCMPWALGTTPYVARHLSDYAPWHAGYPFHAVQLAGAALFLAAIALGGALALRPTTPRPLRRLGLFGASMLPLNVAGFLMSPMVMDHFSSRYLVAFVLVSPFALAPVAHRLGAARAAAAIAPFVVSAAVSGWVSYAPFVHGLAIDASWGRAVEERRLAEALRARGVRYAEADYWASYRLTFLFREDPIVVPTNVAEDRYPPYRAAFEAAPRVAYVFDALRSREAPGSFEARVARGETPFAPRFDRLDLGEFTVLVLDRRLDAAPSAVSRP